MLVLVMGATLSNFCGEVLVMGATLDKFLCEPFGSHGCYTFSNCSEPVAGSEKAPASER